MEEKSAYGSLVAEKFIPGDIVEWTKWDSDDEIWQSHYGVIVELKSKIISNRLVSIATVMPIESSLSEIELFSLSLKLVSRGNETNG